MIERPMGSRVKMPPLTSKMAGVVGEELAHCYLIKEGYKVLLKNYRSVLGEIDLIAKEGEVLVFVEVKTRQTLEAGLPAEAVTFFKQRQIIKSAQCYLKQFRLEETPCRFDVVSVILGSQEESRIELIRDAFGV